MPNKNYQDLVRESKQRIREVTARDAVQSVIGEPETVVVDCREPNEAALGRIPGSVLIPRGLLEQNIERAASRDQKVIVYCAAGNRSALAAETLQEMGYTNVASLAGGFRAWIDAGGDVDG